MSPAHTSTSCPARSSAKAIPTSGCRGSPARPSAPRRRQRAAPCPALHTTATRSHAARHRLQRPGDQRPARERHRGLGAAHPPGAAARQHDPDHAAATPRATSSCTRSGEQPSSREHLGGVLAEQRRRAGGAHARPSGSATPPARSARRRGAPPPPWRGGPPPRRPRARPAPSGSRPRARRPPRAPAPTPPPAASASARSSSATSAARFSTRSGFAAKRGSCGQLLAAQHRAQLRETGRRWARPPRARPEAVAKSW